MTWPTWFDELSDVPVILTIITVFFAATLWVINQKVAAIKGELSPNHGSSLRDAVDRLEVGIAEVKTVAKAAHDGVLRVEERQDAHMEWHLTNKEKQYVRDV